ncbi:hypothetical protein ACFSUS_05860 [Spirosoma soli]|uniref:Uncharacterized protein n=1 Tax=Spirosoma soli TaxID=1770529 RepID=A0ABW5M0R3_9BACT
MPRFYVPLVCTLVGFMAFTCVRDFPATAPYSPAVKPTPPTGGLPPQEQPAAPKRLFIANEKVRLAIDLNMGGAINYLAEAGTSENMVNNFDLGRQIQTAFYGGPYPYSVNGKQPVAAWLNLGWNPVQTGDYYNHPARVLSYQQTGNQLYVKTIPLIWPLFDEPADCVMEHWIELQGNSVHVRCRVNVNRLDTTQYSARGQETPCVYLNGPYYRYVLYDGSQPFTNAPVTETTDRENTNRYGTENWVAILNEQGRGVGLYRPNVYRYKTIGFGTPKVGTEADGSSGYMSNDDYLVIDHNGQYEYDYYLIVGSLSDIRQFAYSQPRPTPGPNFIFAKDRQGWYYNNVRDRGWPIQNGLDVRWERIDTTKADFRLMSPTVFWKATDVPKLYVQAAFKTKGTSARLSWRKPGDFDFLPVSDRYTTFPIIGDGQLRTYEIDLSRVGGWDGVISQISLDPTAAKDYEKGSTLRLQSVTFSRPNG